MTTIFLTGGSGFVGRALIRALVARGDTVRALARSDGAAATVAGLGAEPVRGDLADRAAMQAGMTGCDGVIHAAAKVATWGPWRDFLTDTVEGTKHVLAAAEAAGVPRFVHIGTEAVLADGKAIVEADEETPFPANPIGHYPKSKGLAEQAVRAANRPGFATVVVRPRFIWGKGDTTLLPAISAAMRDGVWRWFGPDHRTSTCHIGNVVHGTLLAFEKGRPGGVYFLTDGEPVDFRQFISAFVATTGVTPTKATAPLWLADLAAYVSELAWSILPLKGAPPLDRTAVNLMFREVTVRADRARAELGYAPVVTIEAGLAELRAA